jgi:hypothetical protein
MENAPAPQARDAMLVPPPSGLARRLASALIALFLLHQLLVPLGYYLGAGGADERFAWRMFSSVFYLGKIRARSCRAWLAERPAAAGAGERAVDVHPLLPSIWHPSLDTGRRDVVEGLLRWRCPRSGAARIRYDLVCGGPEGAPEEPQPLAEIDCASLEVRPAEGAP